MASAQREGLSSPKWNDEAQQYEMKIGYYLLTPKGAKIERGNGRFIGWKRDRKRFRFGQDHRAAGAVGIRKQKEWAELKKLWPEVVEQVKSTILMIGGPNDLDLIGLDWLDRPVWPEEGVFQQLLALCIREHRYTVASLKVLDETLPPEALESDPVVRKVAAEDDEMHRWAVPLPLIAIWCHQVHDHLPAATAVFLNEGFQIADEYAVRGSHSRLHEGLRPLAIENPPAKGGMMDTQPLCGLSE